jgi:uncharacterized RDD family membrane protein YckC
MTEPQYEAQVSGGQPAVYAGFWRRVAAAMIDGVVFSPLALVYLGIFATMGAAAGAGSQEAMVGLLLGSYFLFMLVAMVGGWLYNTLLESSKYQGTLGKIVMGIKVVDLYGNRISFARANGRFFGKWVSGFILYIGFLMCAFTERKQCLHDMIASCLVVRR